MLKSAGHIEQAQDVLIQAMTPIIWSTLQRRDGSWEPTDDAAIKEILNATSWGAYEIWRILEYHWSKFYDSEPIEFKNSIKVSEFRSTFNKAKSLTNRFRHNSLIHPDDHEYLQYIFLICQVLFWANDKISHTKAMNIYTSFRYSTNFSRDIYDYKKKNRRILSNCGKSYYKRYDELHEFPLIAKSDWIPKKLIPIHELDRRLDWDGVGGQSIGPVSLPFFYDDTCFDWIKRHQPKIPLVNWYTYRLLQSEVSDEIPQFSCTGSNYAGYINSSEALAFELASWCHKNPGKTPMAEENHLPFHGPDSWIFDFHRRDTVPGLNALTVFVEGDEKFFLSHQRSNENVAESQGNDHVVPAGTFQPHGTDDGFHNRDFSLRHAILREFGEEVLGIKEAQNQNSFGKDVVSRVNSNKKLKIDIYYMGFGLDPVNLKPDILFLIIARGLNRSMIKGNDEGKIILNEWSIERLMGNMNKQDMLSSGEACFKQALALFNEIENLMVE